MSYNTTWYHLDKDDVVLTSYKDKACFASINTASEFGKNTQYLLYTFKNMKVTQKEATQYFLFLKGIPFIRGMMPPSCTQMAKEKQYKIDLHKYNGTKVFTVLTLIRAVVEDPQIVRAILSFDRKFKYSLSKFAILRMCGSLNLQNSNHWIEQGASIHTLHKNMVNRRFWKESTPCIKTGLGKHIYDTFDHNDGAYWTPNRVTTAFLNTVHREKEEQNGAI